MAAKMGQQANSSRGLGIRDRSPLNRLDQEQAMKEKLRLEQLQKDKLEEERREAIKAATLAKTRDNLPTQGSTDTEHGRNFAAAQVKHVQ